MTFHVHYELLTLILPTMDWMGREMKTAVQTLYVNPRGENWDLSAKD